MNQDDSQITPEDFARVAEQAVRDLNCVTRITPHPGSDVADLEYPGDVYATVSLLKGLARSLPQTCDQLCGFLQYLYTHEQLTADHGDVHAQLSRAEAALIHAAHAAHALSGELDRVHSALAPLGHTDAHQPEGV